VLAALGVAEHVLDFFETGEVQRQPRQPQPNPQPNPTQP
jgi:hypothetical protein